MHVDLKVNVDCNYWHIAFQGNMQNSWITTGENSGVEEAAKRSISRGDADTVKAPSAGEAETWKLELASIQVLLMLSIYFSCTFYCGKYTKHKI